MPNRFFWHQSGEKGWSLFVLSISYILRSKRQVKQQEFWKTTNPMLRWFLHKNMLMRTNVRSMFLIYERNAKQLEVTDPGDFFEGMLVKIAERNHTFSKTEKILKIKEVISLHGRPKNLIDACVYYSLADLGVDPTDARKYSYIQRYCRVELVKRGYRLNAV